MLVSHESPLSMLEKSRSYNDYDYALVHLFEIYPVYLEFFKKSLEMGRTVYLDNSIFELGEAFDTDKFIEYVDQFRKINDSNFYYIIPDSLENKDQTIQNFKDFKSKYPEGNTIGVVQGKNLNELIECFEFMKKHADVVAIGFNYPYYLDSVPENEGGECFRFMRGRIQFIETLRCLGLLDEVKIHLLGCYLPQEFKHYNFFEILSIDTSNPIVHGILGKRYYEHGLNSKEQTKLVDLIEYDGPQDIIDFNILKFKQIMHSRGL